MTATADAARQTGAVHPGGFTITDDAVRYCGFKLGSTVADIGCGTGATVHHLLTVYGIEAVGLDSDSELIAAAKAKYQNCNFICADANSMPFSDSSMEGLLFECSMSKIGLSAALVQKCADVLKDGGYLIVSDVTARGDAAELTGMLGRIDKAETYVEAIAAAGFKIETVKDYTDSLIELWGSLLLDGNASASLNSLGLSPPLLKAVKPSYTLIIARKESSDDLSRR